MAQAAIIDKCELCETEEDVNFFCVSCEEILCSNCKLLHSKNRKTRNDKVIPLSQARDDDLVHQSAVVYCSDHSTVEVTIFCFKCDELMCTQCLIEKHYGHNISILDKIRDSKTEELDKIIKALQDRKADYENVFQAEGQAHSQFLQSIDQAEKGISDQKAKIIEELTIVCDNQFSQLSKLRQDEEKRHTDVCNKFQSQNQAVTSTIQTAHHSKATRNTALIINSTVDATKAYHELEEPTMPQATIAIFHHGDRSQPSICHVQGKINIEQKTIALHQPADKTHPSIPKVQGKVNTEQGAKPKLKSDAHKVKLQEQMTSGDNKQQQKHEDNTPRIDVKEVRVKSTVKVKGKGAIFVIVPLENKTAWVRCKDHKHLTLINSAGKIITTSVSLDSDIYDVKQYRNRLLVTCYNQGKIYSLSLDGKSTSTFCDLSPYNTRGLCVTHDLEVMVCLWSPTDNKVVRLNTAGNVIQTIQYVTGAPLYKDPCRVTSLTTGEVIVRDGDKRIIGVGREGQHLFTWEGEVQGEKLASYMNLLWGITHDSYNNLFVTDYINHRVLVLGKDGSEAVCLLHITQGISGPYEIAVDNTGQLWIGCSGGKIFIIEY